MNRVLTPESKATLGWPFSFALNRLLEAQPWARERLAPFAGMTLELRAPPLPALRFVVLPGGRLEAGGEAPALVVTVRPQALPALMQSEEHFMRSVEVTGDARLASEVLTLMRHLRWDAEEDLSRFLGDAAAHRVMGLARSFAAWQADALRRLAETFGDYAVEEQRLLVSTRELGDFSERIVRLRDGVARLEKRVRSLG